MNQQLDLELIKRIRAGQDGGSREELVIKYLPLVRHIVKNQNIYPADFDDYFQEGAIGLLKAIEQYKPESFPIKFSTFAYLCIVRRIYNKLKQNYSQKSRGFYSMLSLNQSSVADYSQGLISLLPDSTEEPFDRIEASWISERIDSVLQAYLSPLEYHVIQLALKGYSFGETSNILRLAPKAVDNARTRARGKLRKVLRRYGSFLSPAIPLKTRKRKDLSLSLRVV